MFCLFYRFGLFQVDGLYPRALFESMPYMREVGFDFITMPYKFGNSDTGYVVRILSVANSTIISLPAFEYEDELDAGSFYEFEYPKSIHGTAIHCSEPCIAVQYAKESPIADGTPWMLPFMVVLTPLGYYSRSATFATPSWVGELTEVALSIIVDFFPVDDLYLDGNSTEFLEWHFAPNGIGAYATVPLQPGQHHLYTTDPEHGEERNYAKTPCACIKYHSEREKTFKYTLIADLLLTCMLLTTTIYFPLLCCFLWRRVNYCYLKRKKACFKHLKCRDKFA